MSPLERYARGAAALVAALFTAFTIRYSTFVGVIADGSAYVSQARRWLDGALLAPIHFGFSGQIPWPWLEIPLGYRSGTLPGTDVFVYPPGYSLVMAAAMAFGGEFAAHLVAPFMGGLLIFTSGELATLLGGPLAGVTAAVLMGTSAIAAQMSLAPMSDIPAALWWTLALLFATRGYTSATIVSGLSVTMAIMTRPNLAPLALVPAALAIASAPRRRLGAAMVFGVSAAIGPALVMWTQGILYGSPWASGHGPIEREFTWAHVADNVLRYPRWYAESHSPVILLAAIAPFLAWWSWRRDEAIGGRQLQLAGALAVFAVGVYVAYLPYIPFEDWAFLRFMLPAFAPLYALTALVIARVLMMVRHPWRLAVLGVVILATAGAQLQEMRRRDLTTLRASSRPVLLMGPYLASSLPANAVVFCYFHMGSIRYYTGRPIIRFDFVPADILDSLIEKTRAHGYEPYVLIDEELERAGYTQVMLPHTKILRLDWPPRARIGEHGRLALYNASDRQRALDGQTWPIDIVR